MSADTQTRLLVPPTKRARCAAPHRDYNKERLQMSPDEAKRQDDCKASEPRLEDAHLLIALNRVPASTRQRYTEWFDHLKSVKSEISGELSILHGFSKNTKRDAPQMVLYPPSPCLLDPTKLERPRWCIPNDEFTFAADVDPSTRECTTTRSAFRCRWHLCRSSSLSAENKKVAW